ncbi:uncharacterized protein LOC144161839 isoform X1 [Haemaphysalis longicornis]
MSSEDEMPDPWSGVSDKAPWTASPTAIRFEDPELSPPGLIEQLLHNPRALTLPPAWTFYSVDTREGKRIVCSGYGLAVDNATPVMTKCLIIEDRHDQETLQVIIKGRSMPHILELAETPTTVAELTDLLSVLHDIPVCRGGPEITDQGRPENAYPDPEGRWRHTSCELYGVSMDQCPFCASMEWEARPRRRVRIRRAS